LNIPLAILASVTALWVSGQTINIMTLGGLALAVGILVDEATVTIENIHTHLAEGRSLARAASGATAETTLPRFVAMLCILAVFIPAFFMTGAAHNLFVPLALAVGFSMVGSYLLSSTFVPILSVWMLRNSSMHQKPKETFFDRLRARYDRFARVVVKRRRTVVLSYLEPISKSFEEHNEAGKLDKAEEIVGHGGRAIAGRFQQAHGTRLTDIARPDFRMR
jgi:multidrug efflux pump subunit AcrB